MQPDTSVPPTSKILVIDDNPIIQRTIQLALKERGYTVVVAGDVADALKIVRNDKPDLLLLDLSFPPDASAVGLGLRDGFWALDWMNHLKEIQGVPVIIISGSESDKFKPRALAAGAAAYFQKPINADELTATIASLLSKQSAAPAV